MFAFIKNNKISFIFNQKVLEGSDYDSVIEYDESVISDPEFYEGTIRQYSDSGLELLNAHNKKYQEILEAKDISIVSLDGIVFSDKEKGDIILARCFKDEVTGEPNPHAQLVLTIKTLKAKDRVEKGLPEDGDLELLQYAQKKEDEVNELRKFFKYGEIQ